MFDSLELSLVRAACSRDHGRGEQAEQLLRQRTTGNYARSMGNLAQFYVSANRLDEAASATRSGLEVAPNDDRLIWLGRHSETPDRQGHGCCANDTHRHVQLPGSSARSPRNCRGPAGLRQGPSEAHLQSCEGDQEVSCLDLRLAGTSKRICPAGQSEDAGRAALTATQLCPEAPAAAKLATEALGQAGRIEEAIAMATKWRSLAPSDDKSVDFVQARLKCLRGQVEDARGQFKNARSQFEDAVKILKPYEEQILAAAKDRPDDLELYASALASAGQVDKAVQVVGDRFRLDSDWVVRYLRIGEAMMNPARSGPYLAF
jgi:tetratricopeptide (TPR) repeat protein